MNRLLAGILVAWLAVAGLGCAGKADSQKEFEKIYKQYSARFHEKMVAEAESMRPEQIMAEAARIWDETFASHKDLLKRRAVETLADLDSAPPLKEDTPEKVDWRPEPIPVVSIGGIQYYELASGTRVEPPPDQPKGIVLKQFLWNPVGAAQMGLNNWLARLMQQNSFAIRSVLTANAVLPWEALDRNLDKPKLIQRQGPMVFVIELSRIEDYYQVEKIRWLRPKSMGPVTPPQQPAQPESGTTPGATTPGGAAAPATPSTAAPAAPAPAAPATPAPAAKPPETPK